MTRQTLRNSRAPAAMLVGAIFVCAAVEAQAQCPASPLTSGLRVPLGVTILGGAGKLIDVASTGQSTLLAGCLGGPTSMTRDRKTGALYITELANGRLWLSGETDIGAVTSAISGAGTDRDCS